RKSGMERSRSKRYYHDQDYDSEPFQPRNKPRYGSNSQGGGVGAHHYPAGYDRRISPAAGGGGPRKTHDSVMVTTSYRILCHDAKAGGVIGKSGSIIKSIRQHTGAWINVHELAAGDEERIIEISDTRRKDPDGRMHSFSPAQEALLLIHERILDNLGIGDGENDEYGSRPSAGGANKVVTRLVVSRMHVGCLLGKGGKIIEQMRMETNTHIRILPRDHTLPRCVAMSEEIVQVVGDMNAVKAAVEIISSRLRESQHRDRSHFHNRIHSPDQFFAEDDPRMNVPRRSSLEVPILSSRYSASSMKNNHSARSSGAVSVAEDAPLDSFEDLVFRILCPADKLDRIVGESDGILNLLQDEIGVIAEVSVPVSGSGEHVIIVISDEGPDDELFPAQEALLHIQSHIVDLVSDKENIITTRLLLQSDEIGLFHDVGKLDGAEVEVLPRDKLPEGLSETDEILQIVGEIRSARAALVEITSRIRSLIFKESLKGDVPFSAPSAVSSNSAEKQVANSQNSSAAVPEVQNANAEAVKQNESEQASSGVNR
ncbi:hypothetical protein M569_05927, partial [Genlisea aurea]